MNLKLHPKAIDALQILIDSGEIPAEGNFEVTEHLLHCHRQLYASLGDGFNHSFKANAARKYAGKAFLQLRAERGISSSQFKDGLVYVISNPAWPNKFKIGMTTDIDSRLVSYQTYDPNRAYQVESYEYVMDRREVEKKVLDEFSLDLDKGEWVSQSNLDSIIQCIKSMTNPITSEHVVKDMFKVSLRVGDRVLVVVKDSPTIAWIESFHPNSVRLVTDRNREHYIECYRIAKVADNFIMPKDRKGKQHCKRLLIARMNDNERFEYAVDL